MNDFIKQNFFKIIFSFPAILAIVGTVIINLSISKYGIEDFYILSSRNLLVGALFFFLHATFFYLYFAFIDLADLSKNSFAWLLINAIVKPFIFVGFLAQLMLSEPVLTIENKLAISMYGTFGVIALFLGHNWVRDYKKEALGVLSLIFGIPSLICLVVFVLWTCSTHKDFSTIFYYFAGLSLLLFVRTSDKLAGIVDDKKGIQYPSYFIFSKENIPNIHDLFFAIVLLIISFCGLISLYSYKIYPFLNSSVGGGNYTKEISILKKDSQNPELGKIIHYNQDAVYIKTRSNSLLRISQSDIREIKIIDDSIPSF